jgi:hypothetical protein
MKLLNIFLAIGLFTVNAGVKAENIESIKPVDIVVYRSPSCGCCGKWLEHLKKNNFNVKDIVTDEVQAIKDKYGVPNEMASCHTALVDGYVIEGHVPANDINTLLKMKPKVTGIAVPGMPAGTPGMEMGGRKDPYQVISFDSEKHYQVFNSYESK